MSNVFTKRSGLSRTTTLSDFSNPSRMRSRYSAYDPAMPRVLSPTRRHNPHSSGLIYQSAYNRYSQCFGIWHPKTGNRKRRRGSKRNNITIQALNILFSSPGDNI